ncbi:MAG: NUDIX domain-containing protein [Leadbetterella sp.]
MKIRVASVIVREKKILTLKYNYSDVFVFCLPGGNVDFGESLEDGLQRELFEELGLEAEIRGLFGIAEVNKDNERKLHCVFHVEIGNKDPNLNPMETTALGYEWLDLDSIKSCNLYPSINDQLYSIFILNEKINPYFGELEQKIY